MGKDKQRTKGGVKPSSSGRTAELLFKSQNVDFEGQSVFSSYVPVVTFGAGDFDSASSTLSSDTRLLLRKLSKKDAVTKLKALSELFDLFTQNGEVCNEVLPYWPRLYSRVATDDSRKVREVCHNVLEVLGRQVGRNLAPQLKAIAPNWYLGQHDIFAPAASAATKSFNAVFSTEKKQREAILFCREEIFALIKEYLTTPAKKEEKKDAGSEPVDSEPLELRMAYSSLSALTKLIDTEIVDDTQLQSVLDSPQFWGLTKHASSAVRRELFNLVTMVANKKPSLIQRQCIKAISQSLRDETSDCLQSLWNCFLTLTLHCEVFTSDPNLTKSQLLKVCKKGFYGNATSLGPAVLPLVAKIGVDEELVKQLLPALQTGFDVKFLVLSPLQRSSERSLGEKSAILRAYGETLAYFISGTTDDISLILQNSVFPFINALIHEGTASEFAQTLGQLIKKDDFFTSLSSWLCEGTESWNGRNVGNFLAALCISKPSDSQKRRKSVKFLLDEPPEELSCIKYEELPECKRALIKSVLSKSLICGKLDTIIALSGAFNCAALYEDATGGQPSSIVESPAFQISGDSDCQLSLVLDLIRTFPELPVFLSKLSNIFEADCTKISRLKSFILKIKRLKHLSSVTRWLKQDIFCDRIRNLINETNYADEDSLAVVKFVLENHSVFSKDVLDAITTSLCSQLKLREDTDDRFIRDILHLITSLSENNTADKLRPVMTHIWERLVHESITCRDPEVQEQVEFLLEECMRVAPLVNLVPAELCSVILKEVDSVMTVTSVDRLVDIARTLTDDLPYTPLYSLRFDTPKLEDLFNLLNLSFFSLKDSCLVTGHETIKEHLKSSFLTRALFEAKFALKSDGNINDFITPVMKILYALSVCSFWSEFEKYEPEKTLKEELRSELTVMASRWMELLAGNNWNRWREELIDQLTIAQRDIFLTSRTMLNLFQDMARKMELRATSVSRMKSLRVFIEEDSVSLANENVVNFLERLIKEYMSGNVLDISPVIDYLTIQRKDFSQCFNFDRIFYHLDLPAKQILLAVVDVVIRVLQTVPEEDPEDFYSTASCWVSGWLKQCKKLPSELEKSYFFWISKLATATELIAEYARKSPKFTAEYMEFHAANLYLPFYYIFLQLGTLGSKDYVVVRTMETVGIALVSVPSTTLNFIQPISTQIFTSFGPYLESCRPSLKVAAYRLLRKIKPKPAGGQESDELPIVPVELNEVIRKYGEEISVKEVTCLADQDVLTYLLCWDALLTMHADRSCNEFGSFSKEPHLLPRLLSIIFFQLIDLIPEWKFSSYFENPISISPDRIPPPYGHLMCSVLQKALQCLPYPTRWWWNSQLSKPRDKTMVEKFIVKFLSSKLAAEELSKVQWNDSDNVTVHCHPGCNELIAHYKIEDTTVSLTVTLPLNHPLGPISVKISDKKLLGKISHLLNNKSNSLVAGLQLWKENLDAKYSGHEECAICFFILHSSTKSLPKLACKTCNHKFHSACLLKWFSTSNKSECPLCRNLF